MAKKQKTTPTANPYTAPANFAKAPHVRPTTVQAAQVQIGLMRAACNAVRALRAKGPLTPTQFAWLRHNANHYRRLAITIRNAPKGSNPFAPKGSTTPAPTKVSKAS